MWALTLLATTMLVAAQAETPHTGMKIYGQECAIDDDCLTGFTCISRQCECGTSYVLSENNQTCLEAVVYGERCNETRQCLAHVENSVCDFNNTCSCESSFRYKDVDGDHSCVHTSASDPRPASPPRSEGSLATKLSLAAMLFSFIVSLVV